MQQSTFAHTTPWVTPNAELEHAYRGRRRRYLVAVTYSLLALQVSSLYWPIGMTLMRPCKLSENLLRSPCMCKCQLATVSCQM